MKIPLEFRDLLQSANDDVALSDLPGDTEESSDVPHPLDAIVADGLLAAALDHPRAGAFVANFKAASARRNECITQHYAKLAADAEKKYAGKPPAHTPDDTLAKSLTPGGRRRESLRQFLKARLALRESAQSVISFAAVHDTNTACLLREIAAELGVL
jgi:hypothetical protein